jgi:hypothetical protein
MAWKFPKRKIESGEPTGVGDINENFAEYSQESGSINEHNFRSNAISSRTELAATAGFLIKSTSEECDPGIVDGSSGANNSASDTLTIGTTLGWYSALSTTIHTEDAFLWVLGSVQVMAIGTWATCAISVDGYVLPETISGGVTQSNDPNGFGPGASQNIPVVVDAIVPISAGKHTVELVVKFKHDSTYLAVAASFSNVQNRELIVIEMRR